MRPSPSTSERVSARSEWRVHDLAAHVVFASIGARGQAGQAPSEQLGSTPSLVHAKHTRGVSSEGVLSTEARAEGPLFERVVECDRVAEEVV